MKAVKEFQSWVPVLDTNVSCLTPLAVKNR
jgi:hypothetical protein